MVLSTLAEAEKVLELLEPRPLLRALAPAAGLQSHVVELLRVQVEPEAQQAPLQVASVQGTLSWKVADHQHLVPPHWEPAGSTDEQLAGTLVLVAGAGEGLALTAGLGLGLGLALGLGLHLAGGGLFFLCGGEGLAAGALGEGLAMTLTTPAGEGEGEPALPPAFGVSQGGGGLLHGSCVCGGAAETVSMRRAKLAYTWLRRRSSTAPGAAQVTFDGGGSQG
jgi:hypothetical protein